MGFLRGFGLVVFSIVLVLCLTLTIFLFSFNIILYPESYEQILGKTEVFGFIQNQTLQGQAEFIKIDNDNIKPEINRLLGNALSYIRGDTDKLDLTIEVDQAKIRKFFLDSIENMSICPDGKDPFVDNCRPGNMSTEEFLEVVIEKKNVSVLKQSRINLAEVLDRENNLSRLREAVEIYRIILLALIVFSFIALAIILILKRGKLRSGLRWVGASLIISGIIGVVSKVVEDIVSNINLSQEMEIIKPALYELSSIILGRIFLYGVIILIFGIVIWIISFFIKDEKKA